MDKATRIRKQLEAMVQFMYRLRPARLQDDYIRGHICGVQLAVEIAKTFEEDQENQHERI